MENRFCKKCLLDKVMGDAEYKHMQDYIKNIDERHKYNWSISSENKVRVGCIANVFQPGSANQSSIRRDDWISEGSIKYSEDIRKFYEFIVNIINF